jgi:hypothetical protein
MHSKPMLPYTNSTYSPAAPFPVPACSSPVLMLPVIDFSGAAAHFSPLFFSMLYVEREGPRVWACDVQWLVSYDHKRHNMWLLGIGNDLRCWGHALSGVISLCV